MTVGELIAALREFPQDAMVVRNGYEGGMAEVVEAYTLFIELNVNEEWYYAPHEIVGLDEPPSEPECQCYESQPAVKAVFVG